MFSTQGNPATSARKTNIDVGPVATDLCAMKSAALCRCKFQFAKRLPPYWHLINTQGLYFVVLVLASRETARKQPYTPPFCGYFQWLRQAGPQSFLCRGPSKDAKRSGSSSAPSHNFFSWQFERLVPTQSRTWHINIIHLYSWYTYVHTYIDIHRHT